MGTLKIATCDSAIGLKHARYPFLGGKTLKKHWERKLLWIVAIILSAAALWLLMRDGLTALYWIICNALIDVWGVTSKNLYRAPLFVRIITNHGAMIAEVLGAIVLLAITHVLKRWMVKSSTEKHISLHDAGGGLIAGAVLPITLWLFYIVTGTMRITAGTVLSQPAMIGYGVILLLIGLLQVYARMIFAYALVYPLLKEQIGRWGALTLCMALMLLATAWDDSTLFAWLLNAALLTALCCFSYERRGNISGIIGFRLAFFTLSLLLGFPNTDSVLYETYFVNSSWLNGGSSGIMAGLGLTAVLVLLLILEIRSARKLPS